MHCFVGKKKRCNSFKAHSDKRKAQISPFIIVGLLILIGGAVASYVIITKQKAKSAEEAAKAFETGVLPPLSVYVQGCIEQESPPVIFHAAEQGGILEPKEGSYLMYNRSKLNYLCLVEGPSLEFSCANAFLTRQEMQRIIQKEIANRLRRCINLKPFEAQGYEIDEGRISVRTQVGKKSVLVDVNYPINLTKENDIIRVSDFNAEVDLPLGELYDLAMDITNSEISKGYFDIDRWMVDDGAGIIVEKHRPYPDTVYLLSEKISQSFSKFNRSSIKFMFALQQNPSIAQKRPKQKSLYGLCRNRYDDICFENVPEAYCRQVDGIYNSAQGIGCIENFRLPQQKPNLCDGHECRSCKYDLSGKKFDTPKKHGESWCVYDGITGKGYDYVGSRHYKQSCIDGNVVVEECRDYREEFCTENNVNGLNKAVCRVNRWDDCSLCITEECCKDSRFRDCFWNYELTTEKKCVPYVPPGLRFWENEGVDICLRANDKNDCEGISCPNVWIDDAARYCYQQADCGNYRNIADQITYEGFLQSDPADSVRSDIYLQNGWNKNPLDDGRYWSINLPLEVKEYPHIMKDVSNNPEAFNLPTPVGNLPVLLSAALQFIDEIVNLDVSDFLNPFAKRPKIHIVDFAICYAWTAPVGKNYCVLCGADTAKPCTEYRCKSLGERCDFRMEEGVPKCELPSLSDKEPPKISLNKPALTKGYDVEDAELAGNKGYKIKPAIKPHKPFTLGITTTEPARCKLRLAPRFEYYSLPSFWFNDPSFKTEHNLTLRMPPGLSVPKKLLDFLNITSTSGIIPMLENLEPTYEYYKARFRDKLKLYTQVTGDDLVGDVDPKVMAVIDVIKGITPYIKVVVKSMIDQFDKGGYYLFVECSDRAGNINKDEFFVQFDVDKGYVDNEAPVIVYASPPNNSKISKTQGTVDLSLYIDEPAECRYSDENKEFENMEKSFMCNTGYHISPVAGGTYECTASIDRNMHNISFIRCKDSPSKVDIYQLNVILGNESKVIGAEKLNYTNITPDTYVEMNGPGIEVPAKMMEGLSFKTKQFPVNLKMYIADDKDCRYSNNTGNFREMSGRFGKCRISEKIERGIYECYAVIERPSLSEQVIGNITLSIEKSDEYSVVSGYLSEDTKIDVKNGNVMISSEGKVIGESNVRINTENLGISLNLSSKVECKLGRDNGSMSNIACSMNGNKTMCSYSAIVGDRADVYIECVNTTSAEEKSYMFYIGCGDVNGTDGNINKESYVYVTSEAEPLNITLKPSGIINKKETELIVKVTGSISRDKIVCGYNDNPFHGMLEMSKIADDRFGAHIDGLEEGKKYRYYAQCYDAYGNEAEGFTEFEVVV